MANKKEWQRRQARVMARAAWADESPQALAYMAGFFDGEGCVLAHRANKDTSWSIRVAVTNSDRKALANFRRLFGGHINDHAKTSPLAKNVWVWMASGVEAVNCCRILLPHLRCKRRQAALASAWTPELRAYRNPALLARRRKLGERIEALNGSHFWQTRHGLRLG